MDNLDLDWETVESATLILDHVIREHDGAVLNFEKAVTLLASEFGISDSTLDDIEPLKVMAQIVEKYMEEVYGIGENDPRVYQHEYMSRNYIGFKLVPFEEEEGGVDFEDAGQQQPPPNPNGSNNDDNSHGSNNINNNQQGGGGNHQGQGQNEEDFFPEEGSQEDSEPESDSVVSVMVKNLKKELSVEFGNENFRVRSKLPNGSDYENEVHCARKINPENSTFKVMSTKVEIRRRKLEGGIWPALEAEKSVTKEFKPCYPSSSAKTKDWNKVEKEIKKPEGEGLFAKIYNSGDENTKRAMIKLMQESNREEVGQKQIEVSPPDGMEYKKYDALDLAARIMN